MTLMDIRPSPLQSHESSSESLSTSVDVSGFIVHALDSRFHSVNQYS